MRSQAAVDIVIMTLLASAALLELFSEEDGLALLLELCSWRSALPELDFNALHVCSMHNLHVFANKIL